MKTQKPKSFLAAYFIFFIEFYLTFKNKRNYLQIKDFFHSFLIYGLKNYSFSCRSSFTDENVKIHLGEKIYKQLLQLLLLYYNKHPLVLLASTVTWLQTEYNSSCNFYFISIRLKLWYVPKHWRSQQKKGIKKLCL